MTSIFQKIFLLTILIISNGIPCSLISQDLAATQKYAYSLIPIDTLLTKKPHDDTPTIESKTTESSGIKIYLNDTYQGTSPKNFDHIIMGFQKIFLENSNTKFNTKIINISVKPNQNIELFSSVQPNNFRKNTVRLINGDAAFGVINLFNSKSGGSSTFASWAVEYERFIDSVFVMGGSIGYGYGNISSNASGLYTSASISAAKFGFYVKWCWGSEYIQLTHAFYVESIVGNLNASLGENYGTATFGTGMREGLNVCIDWYNFGIEGDIGYRYIRGFHSLTIGGRLNLFGFRF